MAPIRVETALGKRFGKSNTSAQVVWDLNGTAEDSAMHRTAMLHEVRSDTPRARAHPEMSDIVDVCRSDDCLELTVLGWALFGM